VGETARRESVGATVSRRAAAAEEASSYRATTRRESAPFVVSMRASTASRGVEARATMLLVVPAESDTGGSKAPAGERAAASTLES
jgi:hypothetical protein